MQENLTQGSRIPLPENIGGKCDTITNKMWLSYIIPLYNCGEYIAKCLDSVLAQGLEPYEYEVIVINDGSIDNGAEIVAQYCQKHDNFRLINKENGGVSSARNRGIDETKGEYVYFMDADDRLLPDGMKTLRDCYLNKYGHADMISFQVHTEDKNYNLQEWEHIRPHKMYFQGSFLEYGSQYGISPVVYSQIISHQLITKHKAYFQPYVQSQDVMYMLSLFEIVNATTIATNLDIYRYRIRENSAMRRSDKKHVKRLFYGYIDMVKSIEKMKEASPYDKRIFDRHITWFKGEAFVRMYRSSFSYYEIKELLTKASQSRFYPIKPTTANIHYFINRLYQYPSIVYTLSFMYHHLYCSLLKPLRIHTLFVKNLLD